MAARPGYMAKHVALIGDSASGGLAVTTVLRAREQGLPLPAAVSLPCGRCVSSGGAGGVSGNRCCRADSGMGKSATRIQGIELAVAKAINCSSSV
jgi:hypothetical protein